MSPRSHSPRQFNQTEPPKDWLDRLAHFNLHFGRFARDAGGVVLLAVALMSLLALWHVTQGLLLTPWAELLSRWFGWGSYFIIFGIGFAGLVLLGRQTGRWSVGRVVWLELAALLSLGLLAVIGGNSLDRAEHGMDGGQIGWGITALLSMGATQAGGTLILIAAWLLAVAGGFGLWSYAEAWLLRLAGEAPPVVAEPAVSPVETEAPVVEKPGRSKSKRRSLSRSRLSSAPRCAPRKRKMKNPSRPLRAMRPCRR